ncbi:MAG TPA: DUF1499 domain-containing protein [Nitrospirota bacterium]|nr:DUF1499 domain-containing protein [Nitrospirota bacterium]
MNAHQETMKHEPELAQHATFVHYIAPAGLVLAVGAAGTAVLAGLGHRWGWWYFMTGFSLLRIGAVIGLAAAVVSLLGGLLARHEHYRNAYLVASVGIVIGLITAGIPGAWMQAAKRMPAIHDISTDMVNPPEFHAIMPLRANAENPAEYGGPSVAMKQTAAYPDIHPLVLAMPPASAFDRSLATARDMGWQIVSSDLRDGTIEAIATTFWFGFKDDVIVRVSALPGGSRVDIRSVSRVGGSDIGTNAKRIRSFMHKMESAGNSAGGNAGGYSVGY